MTLMLAVSLVAAPAAPPPPELNERLQRGLYAEEVQRDYEAAMTEYRTALAAFDRQRPQAATAIFRLAECLRKVGRKAEAEPLYRRIVQEFPDQAHLVKLSAEQLGTNVTAGAAASPTEGALLEERVEIQSLTTLLKNSPDLINRPAKGGLAPLHWAAVKGHLQVAAYLLDNGADIEGRVPYSIPPEVAMDPPAAGATPLILAAGTGQKAMVEYLLRRGASVEARDNLGRQPLHWACRQGMRLVAQTLLEAKAPINAQDRNDKTPLHHAVEQNHRAVVELLLQRGADVNLAAEFNRTPLHAAATRETAVLKLLLDAKAEVNKQDNGRRTPLHYAVQARDAEKVKLLCTAGARVDVPDDQGMTALALALDSGALDLLEPVLDKVANVNEAIPLRRSFPAKAQTRAAHSFNSERPTPLIWAVGQRWPEACERLLEKGADVNGADGYGSTPLFYAVATYQTNLVERLLARGAEVRKANADGYAPIHAAASRGWVDLTRHLLETGAEVNARNKWGETPLRLAVRNRYQAVAELLIQKGADLFDVDASRKTLWDLVTSPTYRNAPPGASFEDRPLDMPVVQPATPEEMQALLEKYGAGVLAPVPGCLKLCRAETRQEVLRLPQHTNHWNHFTLLELLAFHYQGQQPSGFPFPDWERVRICRRGKDGNIQFIPVNVAEILKNRSGDVPLQWGDVVDLPERVHPANARWQGLDATNEIAAFNALLGREVILKVKDRMTKLRVQPFSGADSKSPGQATLLVVGTGWLSSVIPALSQLYDSDADLKSVRVKRSRVGEPGFEVMVVDVTRPMPEGQDLYLRHGDEIEIPSKPK